MHKSFRYRGDSKSAVPHVWRRLSAGDLVRQTCVKPC